MLWSIDSCQNRISADQYHLTVPRSQVSTHRGRVFFEVFRWQVISFQTLISNWPRGKQLLLLFLTMVTLFVQFLCSDWSKFDRWVHAENCDLETCLLWQLKLTGVSCQLVMLFNCLFPLDVQNEIQILTSVFCCPWLVCLLGFWLRNAPFVKIR